jgi:UDP-GlcNAc:undecaprenyl-phosphate GlcNAc-1-phosphate transferase
MIGLSIAACVCSGVLTAYVKHRAIKTGFVSRPREDRYNHNVVALGGGVAIFWTITLLLFLIILAVPVLMYPFPWKTESMQLYLEGFDAKGGDLLIVMPCVFILHLTGLWDDKRHLGPFVKLSIQFAVAFIAAWFADIRVEMFIENKLITTALSVFWIVLMINAFNFLDNMDGASAGIALIATCVLLVAAIRSGQIFVGGMGMIFAGALLGFLLFNFPPAKIFMGDCGSMVIGFFVALLTLRTTYYDPEAGTKLYSVFMPAIVMAVPLYDFISVTFLRLKQGKSPFVGDTQHFSHRLKRRGLSDRQVALTLYLATLCTGLGAVLLQQAGLFGAVLIATQTVMVLIFIAILEAAGSREGQ